MRPHTIIPAFIAGLPANWLETFYMEYANNYISFASFFEIEVTPYITDYNNTEIIREWLNSLFYGVHAISLMHPERPYHEIFKQITL